ncbi:MAG: bifunctional diaminohydroxyphosphoribosylaminopyrimidine deaminase/5-amino-6-(5-phosphoribosylamino)uracil reductase RibD [Planctomycetota bacterium]|jgi:diaminohydroxyphosphoribosylaminopyrimidine deaminase/5-amino-6-(5-phosphoribosylamino)uracil reductase
MNHEDLMREAIALAAEGRGGVEPNPRVGAVALQQGRVVGRGYHAFWGGPHAEVVALEDARRRGARPDTLVVTLEPCSSAKGTAGKKTEPCTERIKAAGIRTVVVGAEDQDPRHQGGGIRALGEAGIEVTVALAAECRQLNRPFARWLGLTRPWTIAKWAMSLDGKAAATTGDARWISGDESRQRVHQLRARVDGVVVGFRTAQQDDPMLDVRHVDGPNPTRIVVDPKAELALDSKLVRTAREQPTLVLTADGADKDNVERLAHGGVEVRSAKDLPTAWQGLRQAGMRRLLVEGGGELVAQLLAADLVDQVVGYLAPKIIGGQRAPTPVGGEGIPQVADAVELHELYWRQSGDDLEFGGFVL